MPLLSRLRSLRRNLFTRRHVERDLDEELTAYLDQLSSEKERAGMSSGEARRAAAIDLGGLEQVKEEVREVRTGQMLEQFLQDVRYGIRTLRKNPAFTLIAVMALALGIGANTTIFSVAYGMLFRPLPYGDADRVAVVFMRFAPRDFAFGTLCMRDYLVWKESNRAFEDPSLFTTSRVDIGGAEGIPEQVPGASVTAGFFSTLQVRPLLGRTFAAGEDKPSAGSLTVLSEPIWRRRFGASPAILGRSILVNGAPSTVIGVVPAIRFPQRATEVWTNILLKPPERYGPWLYRGIARLKPGVTLQQAQAETDTIARRMMQQNPYYKRLSLPVLGVRDAVLGTTIRPAMLVLSGAVALLMLIAVVNVANLMLARATVREREMALRLSLGAARGRLVRQLLTESVLLALLGSFGGVVLAWGAVHLVRVWNPGDLPLVDAIRLDVRALGFAALMAMVTGILFGLAPALAAARTDLNSAIREGGRGRGPSGARGRARSALVVAEIALSLMLLVGAGLLLRTLANLQSVTGGFSAPPSQILTMLISPGNKKYKDAPAGLAFYDEVLRRARSVQGVQMAALTDSLPPDRQGDADTFQMEGQTLGLGEMNPVVSDGIVSPDLFPALGVPLVKGRYFAEHDGPHAPQVAIVSEGFARRFFPDGNVIGKRIKQSGPGMGNNWMEVVGVVGNIKYLGLTVDTDAAYYMPFAQSYGPRMFLVIRSTGDAASLSSPVRDAVQSVDPGITLAQIETMDEAFQLSISQPRFDSALLTLFAAVALLLAAVGIYGLIAYSVAQRTHEIGVRMALGAAQPVVMRMVVRQGALLGGFGIVIGMTGAFGLTRLLRAMLFGVGITDSLTFAAAAMGLMFVVLLATFVPAFRATRISPVAALRCE